MAEQKNAHFEFKLPNVIHEDNKTELMETDTADILEKKMFKNPRLKSSATSSSRRCTL